MAKEAIKEINTAAEQAELASGARVSAVTREIEAARVDREKKENETGVKETPGQKADREAEEKKRLEQAKEVRFIEPIEGSGGNALQNGIITKMNQIIAYINRNSDKSDFEGAECQDYSGVKPTDSLYYNETGNVTAPATSINTDDSGEYDGEDLNKKKGGKK